MTQINQLSTQARWTHGQTQIQKDIDILVRSTQPGRQWHAHRHSETNVTGQKHTGRTDTQNCVSDTDGQYMHVDRLREKGQSLSVQAPQELH